MNRYQSERQVKPRRPVRRSMAELAASLQSDASANSPLELPPTTQRSPAMSLEENVGVNINSSLEYANALANASAPLSVSSEAADQTRELEVESEMQRRQLLVTAEAAQQYRAKAFELMTANVKANLDYANKLRKLMTPLEFIELSTTHARKQFELIISQTAALGALSRSLTKASAERMSAGIESVFGHGQLKT